MKNITLFLSWALMATVLFGACKKQDDNDDDNNTAAMSIYVDYPIANVNDRLTFDLYNKVQGISGVRWDMGDGRTPVSGQTYYQYTYTTAGTYTVTATVFHENTSTELTRQVTIEGPNTNPQGAIRIKKIELIQFNQSVNDLEYNSGLPQRNPDIYFDINYVNQNGNYINLYFKSEVKTDNTSNRPTWILDNTFPLIYYSDVERLQIGFSDDDSAEGSNDDYYGSIDVYDYYIQSVLSTKPTTIQLSEFSPVGPVDLTIIITVEWL